MSCHFEIIKGQVEVNDNVYTHQNQHIGTIIFLLDNRCIIKSQTLQPGYSYQVKK